MFTTFLQELLTLYKESSKHGNMNSKPLNSSILVKDIRWQFQSLELMYSYLYHI